MTAETMLVLAAAGQAALTAVALVMLGRGRIAALKAGEYRLRDVATDRRAYPVRLHARADNVSNQFETPVLFFAAIAIALAAGLTSWTLAALAWAWLLTRAAHMAIHLGSNEVRQRFYAFGAGCLLLLAMWLDLTFAALSG